MWDYNLNKRNNIIDLLIIFSYFISTDFVNKYLNNNINGWIKLY